MSFASAKERKIKLQKPEHEYFTNLKKMCTPQQSG